MARRKKSTPSITSTWAREVKLPSGRILTEGDEFTVKPCARYKGHWGTGRYRFKYARPNGELTAFGPIRNGKSPKGRVRSFRVSDVDTVHNTRKAHAA